MVSYFRLHISKTMILSVSMAALLINFAPSSLSFAQDRMPALKPEQYDAEQQKAAAEFLEKRKVPVFGPFEPLMRSPELMSDARAMGDYLRYKSSIGQSLSELVIIITARAYTQDYEWYVHAPIALKQGIAKDTIDAIADGRAPVGMSADEQICYDFSTELLTNKRVSDPTYERALKRFGEKGVIDLAGIIGYYTFLALELNTTRYALPADGKPLKRFPDQ